MDVVHSKRRRAKRGAALVELALVLMLLVLLVFGVLEYGWMFLRMQEVTNAARAGARLAVIPSATTAMVEDTVESLMHAAAIYDYNVSTVPPDVSNATLGAPITVTVAVPYQSVELTGMSIFPGPASLTATATMAKEHP